MTTTTKRKVPKGRKGAPTPRRPQRYGPHRSGIRWGTVAITALSVGLVVLGFVLAGRSGSPPATLSGALAPDFSLPTTDGGTERLVDHRGHPMLLYFNEGIGCDACFYQMVEIEKEATQLDDRGLMVMPIVMNAPDDTVRELDRFGLTTPFLSDEDGSVSKAYDVLGKGHHAGLPGHSFLLVDPQGAIEWRKDYSVMFVPVADLLAEIDAA